MAFSLFVLLSALFSVALLRAVSRRPVLQLKRIPQAQQRRRLR